METRIPSASDGLPSGAGPSTPASSRWAASLGSNVSRHSFPRTDSSRGAAHPLSTPLSARSRGKRRAHPWDEDDADMPSRKQRRCERAESGSTPRWSSPVTSRPLAGSSTAPHLATAPAFGLRPLHGLPTRSRPPALSIPAAPARPAAFFRRSTSDPPPSSPTTFQLRHDRSFDALNDTVCRAQSLFVQGFADAQSTTSPPAPPRPSDETDLDPMSSPSSVPSADLASPMAVSRGISPCAIPPSADADPVPELCASSSETSTASWFGGVRFTEPVDSDSDEDEIVMDTRRHSVDDLSYLLTKTDICRPVITRRSAMWDLGQSSNLSGGNDDLIPGGFD